MSDKRFKIPAPPPMYAIRSCIADKAKTIDEARFTALEQTVEQSTALLTTVTEKLQAAEVSLQTMDSTLTSAINTLNDVTKNVATATANIETLTNDLTSTEQSLTELSDTVTAKLNDTSDALDQLKTDVEEAYDNMVDYFNTAAKYINQFNTILDGICTLIFPTGSIVYSALPPEKYIAYDKTNGVWNNLPGNWGWTTDPVTTYTFTWYDPVEAGSEEPDTTNWDTTTDSSVATEVGGTTKHTIDIDIYAYYCVAEEEVDWSTIETLPTLSKIAESKSSSG